jgi:transposase
VTATGLGLAFTAPVGPVQPMLLQLARQEQHGQQAAHLWHGHGNQAASVPPFAPVAALARVTSRKAWASKQRVMCRYHPSHRRTSYWSSPIALARWKLSSIVQRIPATRASSALVVSSGPKAR